MQKIEYVYNVREVRTIKELWETSRDLYGELTAFVFRDGDKKYKEAFDETVWLSTYFNSLGLQGKKIAVIGRNCYEWALTYLAAACGTGIILPIDKELKPAEISNILNITETAAVIYSPELEKTISDCDLNHKPLKLSMGKMKDYLNSGRKLLEAGDTSYADHIIDPYAMGILLFTSGTTGMAKGVMLSHNNICSDIVSMRRKVVMTSDDRVISVLPLHHTYECTAGFLTALYSGSSISYAESLRKIVSDIQFYSPTIIIAVPLLLENIHKNIVKKAGKMKIQAGKIVSVIPPLKNIVFKQIHNTFGGKLRLIISGAASLPPDIARDFAAFGFTVYQGYGLTETSPVSIMHNDSVINFDTIGKPIVGVEVKLMDVNEDGVGEIAIKGPNVMLGYYNNPEETEKVLRDGWFYSGDLATVDKDGCYKIVGRIKNVIVTKNGKKIFPEEMEYFLSKSPYIAECMIYGEETEQDTIVNAVILPDFEAIEASGNNSSLKDIMTAAVKAANSNVPNYKAIRKFIIRKTEFDKTTTKKIKRNSEENYEGDSL